MIAAREIVLRALCLKWDQIEEKPLLAPLTSSKEPQPEMRRPSGTGESGTYAG